MRKTSVVLAAVAMLAVSSMASAMTMTPGTGMKGSWMIGPMGGLNVPSGDLSKDFSDNGGDQGLGFNFGGLIDYMLTDAVAIGVDAAYNQTKNKDDIPGAPGVELKAKTTNFGVHGEWFIPTGGGVLPYLGAGVGYYNRKLEASGGGVSTDVSKGGIGVNGGVGLGFKLTPSMGFGVDARYHWTQKDKFVDDPAAEDVNWSFMTFNAALLFHIPMGGGAGSSMGSTGMGK